MAVAPPGGMQTWDVIVIGAGISGLSSAVTLARSGLRPLVIDRRDHVGGRAVSERIGGFLMEHGPSSLVAPAPAAEGLIEAVGLGCERVVKGEGVRRRYLVRGGAVRGLPLSPAGFFLSPFFTWRGRLRLMLEPLVPSRTADETVAAWVRRRFGTEFLDYMFDPLVGGLMAGTPDSLSMEATFPHLKRMERDCGSILRAVARARRRGVGAAGLPGGRQLFSFRDGMAALPRALAAPLAGSIRLRTRVTAVVPAGEGFLVTAQAADDAVTFRGRSVVVALPAYAAARLLEPLRPALAAGLHGIPHPPLSVVFHGYRREDVAHPLDGLGFLTPTVEQRRTLGVLFSSTLFPGRAPEGHVGLTSFVGGARQPELALLPDDALHDLVQGETHTLLGTRGKPVVSRIRRWPRGLPQPGLGHAACLDQLRGMESELPGLFVTGNYINGVSTVACIGHGIATAEKAARHLSPSTDLGLACA